MPARDSTKRVSSRANAARSASVQSDIAVAKIERRNRCSSWERAVASLGPDEERTAAVGLVGFPAHQARLDGGGHQFARPWLVDVEGGRDAGDGGRGAGLLRGLDRVEHVDGRAADDAGVVGVVAPFREAGQRTPGLAPADRDHGAFHGLDVLIVLDLLAAGALARHDTSNA